MLLVSDLAERILPGTKEAAVTEEIDTSASVTSEFVWGGDTTSGTGNSGGGVAMGTSRASSSSGTGGVGVGGGGGMKALEAAEKLDRMASVLTRHELILLLTALPSRLGLQPQARHSGRICVGMLGYPNGKCICMSYYSLCHVVSRPIYMSFSISNLSIRMSLFIL